MNRYSLIFAVLVAASFGVHSTPAGQTPPAAGGASKYVTKRPANPLTDEPVGFIQGFLSKTQIGPGKESKIQILFATVPHPVETHLAYEFDQNLDALQDGLQDAGYLFDSSWIPWSNHEPRDRFDDDDKEKNAKEKEDISPGILLFRRHDDKRPGDSYRQDVVVFLISEKPTEGVATSQVRTALEILKSTPLPYSGPIRILGPAFSGSLPSLIPALKLLHDANPNPRIVVRSGEVSGGIDAKATLEEISSQLQGTWVDFGSTQHDNFDSIHEALQILDRIGVPTSNIATLSERESAYGQSIVCESGSGDKRGTEDNAANCSYASQGAHSGAAAKEPGPWKLFFPRDISSLRAGYEKQGIFDATAPTQPWNRALDLKSDDQNEGDSIHQFGGAATQADQESVLFGISEFVRAHSIHAVIISATNEEDLYFLTQFLHAHNGDVRVMLMGAKRIFMRGSTAQFRGDMVVADFPLLPKLHEWTAGPDENAARIFADDGAEGTYFAAFDLFAQPEQRRSWYPEYAAPNWEEDGKPVLHPPTYVAAVGGNSTWPVSESSKGWLYEDRPDRFRLAMPFALFGGSQPSAKEPGQGQPRSQISVGKSWRDLFIGLFVLTVLYCGFFWYAKPVSRIVFASYEPSLEWPFWFFKVAMPGAVAGLAFSVLAWAVALPKIASPSGFNWWMVAEAMVFLSPLAIAVAAMAKALHLGLASWKEPLQIALQAQNASPGSRQDIEAPAQTRPQGAKPAWSFGKSLRRLARELRLLTHDHPGLIWIAFLPSLASLILVGIECRTYFYGADRSVGAILNTYREMHGESGLSLVPTLMLFLLAVLVWTSQAGNGAALFDAAPVLPDYPNYPRISQERAKIVESIGRPLPSAGSMTWFWVLWGFLAAALIVSHFFFRPFVEITSLESYVTTCFVRGAAGAIVALITLDVLQFLWLWDELHGLLHALNSREFKRSFVPIQDFKWKNLWSFTGISLRDRRAILGGQIQCIDDLKNMIVSVMKNGAATKLEEIEGDLLVIRKRYIGADVRGIDSMDFRYDLDQVYRAVARAGTAALTLLELPDTANTQAKISTSVEALQRVLACQCKSDAGRFSDEAEALARLPEWRQTAEKLICLIYIGFIQTAIARLHTLLISVATMFSLTTLGIAIYPFAPITPFLLAGLALLALIGWAFFKVFSEMDTDPILSRIVNGDDSKLQGHFYTKFAEAIALPLLTLGSSLLPGGAGRLLELAQTLFSHGQ